MNVTLASCTTNTKGETRSCSAPKMWASEEEGATEEAGVLIGMERDGVLP